jgi:hypothetical protein
MDTVLCKQHEVAPLAAIRVVALETNAAGLLLWLQMSSKLESVLQQQAAERDEQQQQLQELSQQLADTQEQVAWLQQVRPGWLLAGTLQPHCCRDASILLMHSVACYCAAQTSIVLLVRWQSVSSAVAGA